MAQSKHEPDEAIEITPAMIEAGAVALDGQLWEDALGGYGASNSDRIDLAKSVLRATFGNRVVFVKKIGD